MLAMLAGMHECRARRSGQLDGTTTVLAGQDVDFKYPLQPLGPRHRDVARGCGFVAGLGLVSAAPGRRHLCPQSMVRRKDAAVTRKVDPRRRHSSLEKVGVLDFALSAASLDGCARGPEAGSGSGLARRAEYAEYLCEP